MLGLVLRNAPQMRTLLRASSARFVRDERGASAIEYGLIAGLIAVVIIGALTVTGTSLDGIFTMVSEELDEAAGD